MSKNSFISLVSSRNFPLFPAMWVFCFLICVLLPFLLSFPFPERLPVMVMSSVSVHGCPSAQQKRKAETDRGRDREEDETERMIRDNNQHAH